MEDKLIEELSSISDKLGGTIEHTTTYDSSGRSSKKITIEYSVENIKREVV